MNYQFNFIFHKTLKQEICQMEDLRQKHEVASRSRGDLDPQKLQDKLKKLEFSLDLTNQRCAKYEARVKELEGYLQI